MKNKFLIILILFLSNFHLQAEDLSIQAKNIKLDKDKKTTVFQNDVVLETIDKKLLANLLNLIKILKKLLLKIM